MVMALNVIGMWPVNMLEPEDDSLIRLPRWLFDSAWAWIFNASFFTAVVFLVLFSAYQQGKDEKEVNSR